MHFSAELHPFRCGAKASRHSARQIAKYSKIFQNIAKYCKILQNIAKYCKQLQEIKTCAQRAGGWRFGFCRRRVSRELGLGSRDRECNLQLPSAHPMTGCATTCVCIPEPRSGVGADGSGRLSTERGRGPSEIGPDPTARLPRKLGRGTPALQRRRGRSTLSPVCCR